MLASQYFELDYEYDYALSAAAGSGPYYWRADSIASRGEGDFSAQSAYTLVTESEAFEVTDGAASDDGAADDAGAAGAADDAGAVDADSTTWFKTSEPAKDCSWVASYDNGGTYTRCQAKGDDGTYAYESCAATCADYDR